MLKILAITGTRPEIIKMSPIISQAHQDNDISLFHTDSSQHYDYKMNRVFFDDLRIPYPDFILSPDRKNTLTEFSSMFEQIGETLREQDPDIVLAQGDTNTVMISALVSNLLGYPFGHVEAGIRSFDLTMPEEINRRIADLCSAIHFCPTKLSGINLLFERIEPSRIFITGNTIVDSVRKAQKIIKTREKRQKVIFSPNFSKKILVTLHRPSNVDNLRNLRKITRSFEISSDYKFIFPIHPRTLKNLRKYNLIDEINKINNVFIIEPLGYLDFLSLLSSVDLVITDSGGVQEECLCLGKKCLTIRNSTERPETIYFGSNKLVDVETKAIVKAIVDLINLKEKSDHTEILGNGNSAQIILNILKDLQKDDFSLKSPKMHEWEDYQYVLEKISGNILVKDYEKRNNKKILMIFDTNGVPHIPYSHFLIKKKFQVVTIGIF